MADSSSPTAYNRRWLCITEQRIHIHRQSHSLHPHWAVTLHPGVEIKKSDGFTLQIHIGLQHIFLKCDSELVRESLLEALKTACLPLRFDSPPPAFSLGTQQQPIMPAISTVSTSSINAPLPRASSSLHFDLPIALPTNSSWTPIERGLDTFVLAWGDGTSAQRLLPLFWVWLMKSSDSSLFFLWFCFWGLLVSPVASRDKQSSLEPLLLSTLSTQKVRQIAAGVRNAFAVTEAGQVFGPLHLVMAVGFCLAHRLPFFPSFPLGSLGFG